MNQKITKESILDYVWITGSALLTAIAVNLFFASTTLAPGGITGLSIVFSAITNISISSMSLCISIPLLLLALIFLGKSFGMKTLYITLLTPVCMKVIPMMDITQLSLPHSITLTIAAISGGLLVGTAIGIALRHDCATGGTDVMALLIQKFFKIKKLSYILYCLDGSVIIASGFITKTILVSAFSLLSLIVIVQTINYITSYKKKEALCYAK